MQYSSATEGTNSIYEWDTVPEPGKLTLTPQNPFTPQELRFRQAIYSDPVLPANLITESCPQGSMDFDLVHGSAQDFYWQPDVLMYRTNDVDFVHYKVQSSGNDGTATIYAGQGTLLKNCP